MIRWGIIGAGNIAHRFAEGLKFEEDAQLYAFSCRKQEKADHFQQLFSGKPYLSHDELLDDPNVDAVYIALPHPLHREYILKALKKHKAVLSEKPAVMNTAEMDDVIACAREENVLFMEAMKCRFTPAYLKMKEYIAEHDLGRLKEIHTSFCFSLPMDAKSYHLEKESGGPLSDTGIYCLSWLEDFASGDLKDISVIRDYYHDAEVYHFARMKIGDTEASLECAFNCTKPAAARLVYENAEIMTNHLHRPDLFYVTRGDETETFTVPYEHTDFYSEIHHFDELLRNGQKESEIMPLAASRQCFVWMDELRNTSE